MTPQTPSARFFPTFLALVTLMLSLCMAPT
ncbi:hypothetical protein ALP04_04792 [Pseudomonas amygdali pv. sesami]|nr:hypothetical protein ALP04_04792 [Pseudomonas amygdali pv. sesami]